jgi:predicted alpha/beta hydrolase family esterase
MNVIIVHGFAATKNSNWFPWLSKTLAHTIGASVYAVSLPHPGRPDVNKWIGFLDEELENIDGETIFVAHSLGCVTLLKYIEGLPETAIVGGVILVSAFDESLPLLPLLNSFVETKPNYERIVPKIKKIHVLASTNDIIVPMKYTKKVADQLRVPVIEVQKAGHFTAQDGYKVFPEVYQLTVEMMGCNKQ